MTDRSDVRSEYTMWHRWRQERDDARAEVERLREAIRRHRDTLDAQANGALPRRDRDDIDNELYNTTLGVLG